MTMKKNLLASVIILLASGAYAQDIHFSQFYEFPSQLNPALVGVTKNIRASLQYKNQWGSVTVPYKTYGATFEMKFNQKTWEQGANNQFFKKAGKNLAWGISVFSDKAGDGDMGLTQASFSLSSPVALNEQNTLAIGIQGSFAQRSVDYSKLIWPNQYSGSQYDRNLNSGENFSASKFTYGDFAAGLLWTYGKGEMYMTANDEVKANAGVSVYHISRPKESYLSNTSEVLNMRFVVHGGMAFGIRNTTLDIAPSFMLNYQGPSKEILFGTLFKYNLQEDSKYTGNIKSTIVSVGGYYRNNDAIIPTLLLEMGQYALGISYDVNISDLNTASSSRGGIEVAFRFVTPNPFLYTNKPRY